MWEQNSECWDTSSIVVNKGCGKAAGASFTKQLKLVGLTGKGFP